MDKNISPDDLETVTGGYTKPKDNFDPLRCQIPRPHSVCRIRNAAERCIHLKIEKVSTDGEWPEKYRYICGKGCFDYTNGDMHSVK